MNSLEELKIQCLSCKACPLSERRRNVVFGVGDPFSPLMLVGEGPGEQEDLRGEPFVGPAGQLLDLMLELIDMDRSRVYIANIVKCRPPGNRDPRADEQNLCSHWLSKQIDLINPKIIVCLGRIAACYLINPELRITREHGRIFPKDGRLYIPSYHPSALLRDESKRPDAMSDFFIIRKELHSLSPESSGGK